MTNEVTGASERPDDRGAVGSPVERPVRPLVEKCRDMAAQAGHYGAWSGGVLLEQAADELERLDAWAVAYYQETRTALLKERESIARWLEGQGQPGYAHEVRHGAAA